MIRLAFAFIVSLSLLPLSVQAKSHNGFSHPSKPIVLNSTKPEFSIRLKSNRTTGYSWFMISHDAKLVRIMGSKYIKPNSKRMGEPGMSVWTFRMLPEAFKVQHATKIRLLYARPWEMKKGKVVTFIIVSRSKAHLRT